MKSFLIPIIILFLFSGSTLHSEQTDMTESNCLTKDKFNLAVQHLKQKEVGIHGWTLTYINKYELNRIAFSKSGEGWTYGFILDERGSIEVVSIVKESNQNRKIKDEIKKVFCEFIETHSTK